MEEHHNNNAVVRVKTNESTPYFPLDTCDYRFDQRNEMFKRRTWDEQFIEHGNRLYLEAKYDNSRYGYRKLDYALRNAAWNIEYGYAFGTMKGNHGLYSWDHVPAKAERFVNKGSKVEHSPEVNARIIKKAAKFLGADDVGICYAHPSLVYSHEMDLFENVHRRIELPEGCTHAIVMAVTMDYESSRYSPDAIAGAATGLGYSQQAIIANYVAAFIKGMGYKAVPSGNDTAISIPLAIASGLGELGRNGLLIHREFGPRVRICKVFTDMPLEHDNFKPFGVKQFCITCKKCAKHCPSKSISFDDKPSYTKGPTISNHSGIQKWYINPESCFLFWVKNWIDCNNCVMVCPFNKPAGLLHDTVRFAIKHVPIMNRFMLIMDDFFGYGKFIKQGDKRFWEE